MKKKIVAIITARGGSKGLPRKNVLDLNGKPLIAHTIDAAKESQVFDKIVVTTDDKEIKEVSLKFGAEVIDRPAELATDMASSIDVLLHALRELSVEEFTHFVLLQPTSPLRNGEHIQESMNIYSTSNAKSLVSVTEVEHTPYKLLLEEEGEIVPLFSEEYLTMPRQKLPTTYRINGAIYISKVSDFLNKNSLFEKPLVVYKMDQGSSMDIDTQEDLVGAKNLLMK